MGSILSIIISYHETNEYSNKKERKIRKERDKIFEPRPNNLVDDIKIENKEEKATSSLLINKIF